MVPWLLALLGLPTVVVIRAPPPRVFFCLSVGSEVRDKKKYRVNVGMEWKMREERGGGKGVVES